MSNKQWQEDENRYRIEQDARTLQANQEILSDKARLTAAQKKIADDITKLQKVVKKSPEPTKKAATKATTPKKKGK